VMRSGRKAWDGNRNMDLPQALHIVWPLSSRRQRGVTFVPQFLHDNSALLSAAKCAGSWDDVATFLVAAIARSLFSFGMAMFETLFWRFVAIAFFAMRLL
jgi:hypothetical protein